MNISRSFFVNRICSSRIRFPFNINHIVKRYGSTYINLSVIYIIVRIIKRNKANVIIIKIAFIIAICPKNYAIPGFFARKNNIINNGLSYFYSILVNHRHVFRRFGSNDDLSCYKKRYPIVNRLVLQYAFGLV